MVSHDPTEPSEKPRVHPGVHSTSFVVDKMAGCKEL